MRIGVLSLQGSVEEHLRMYEKAAGEMGCDAEIMPVKTKKELETLDGLIIPGGESTVLWKLIERDGLAGTIKKIPAVFGTCAGAILMAKRINGAIEGQDTLKLMDIEIDRNAYGSQSESFEKEIETEFGKTNGIFIRAPKIIRTGKGVKIIAKNGDEIAGCSEEKEGKFYLALAFHPELNNSRFHRYFIEKIKGII